MQEDGMIPNHITKYTLHPCHYTITAYGKDIEPHVPDIDRSIDILIELSAKVGRKMCRMAL